MDFRNVADVIGFLDAQGEAVTVDREVDPVFEIAALIRKSSDTSGPAFRIPSVKGHPGWTVVGGVYNYRRVAKMLDCSESDLVKRFAAAVKHPIAPVRVSEGECQRHVLTGDDVDLTQLPIPVHSEDDAGRYITAGVIMAHDPVSGSRAMGIHRLQLKGPRKLGLNAPEERRVSRAFLHSEDLGQPLHIAVVIGGGPYIDLASQAKVSHDVDKLGVAGGLRGKPIGLIKAVTSDVEVPADAQLVLEGRILPGVRELEGPFGEVAGTYGEEDRRAVVEIDAITYRDKIYQTVLTGMPTTENHVMGWPAICESVRRYAEQATPDVVDVHAVGPYYVAIVSIKKRMPYEARNVILSVLGPTAGAPQAKYCIVVDEDIDVRNWDQVLWALYTRVQPQDDVLLLPLMVGSPLDPSAPIWRHSQKIGFDATKPLGEEGSRFRRVLVPGSEDATW